MHSSLRFERLSRSNGIHTMIVLIIVVDMASSDHSAQTAVHGSVTAVLQLVNVELQQLLVRREEVAKRIRSLYTAVNALKEFAARPVSCTVGPACKTMREKPNLPEMSIANPTESMDDASLRLRRACRIALLETDEPLSEQEICTRILRRGSFSFVKADLACPAILQELTAMTEAGEICCFLSGSSKKWQQILREPDSSTHEFPSKFEANLLPRVRFSAKPEFVGRIDSH
jgi:hypothetical protein